MKFSKKLLVSSIAASAVAFSALTPVANAEVSASVGVANMYYWRGLDLGNGDPAVSGDINVSASGFYAGIWGSSGDAAAGTEYDLYLGYGGEAGSFTYDISVWNYNYPSATDDNGADASPDIGDLAEVVGSVGFGPVTVTYYHGIQDLEDYWYGTIEAAFGQFSIKYGVHETDLAHVDLSYAYNDNLTFTLGQVVDDVDSAFDDDLKFVVSYSLPIE